MVFRQGDPPKGPGGPTREVLEFSAPSVDHRGVCTEYGPRGVSSEGVNRMLSNEGGLTIRVHRMVTIQEVPRGFPPRRHTTVSPKAGRRIGDTQGFSSKLCRLRDVPQGDPRRVNTKGVP
jgi:hypothetical protein